jgi:hypothetical protein
MNYTITDNDIKNFHLWRSDWNKFIRDACGVRLDKEQQAILTSVQNNPMTAVASGTARGKDFVAACSALCFFYLTPKFDELGRMVENTKVAMTAPTGRQVHNIMTPEIRRLYRKFPLFPGRLVADDIRTDYDEWFLTGFKAGDDATEAWSGFHASNTMFVITEASGISEKTFDAIEGNLQGNSRMLIVFNPNVPTGYAARAMKSSRFNKFRLNSLNAENVVKKENVISGQVDYEWVKDKVETWTTIIRKEEFDSVEGDFEWEGGFYRPNDLFRIKVLGMFPKVGEDVLIPYEWISKAQENWRIHNEENPKYYDNKILGVDVAGMGRDSSVLCHRIGRYVNHFDTHQSKGQADHMHIAGLVANELNDKRTVAFIDTIGEGAGVYSRLIELGYSNAHSCKFSQGATGLTDVTGVYSFINMRAYLFWAVRDWLNPKNNTGACLPPDDDLMQEATEIKWQFTSMGSIQIEAKEDIKKRLKRSTDKFDALANTFYPNFTNNTQELHKYF